MENGDFRMENGKLTKENGKWRVKNAGQLLLLNLSSAGFFKYLYSCELLGIQNILKLAKD